MDSIEFISGPADSTWGAKRAAMGRAEPWNLTYLAIGNEASSAAKLTCCTVMNSTESSSKESAEHLT